MNNKKVKVLRDTGCSSAAVRGSLVDKQQLTGEEATCLLIDGTERRFPLARIYVNTPYYTGHVVAMCMENPLYDLVVGNIAVVKEKPDIDLPMEGNAIVIKARTEKVPKNRNSFNRRNRAGINPSLQTTLPLPYRPENRKLDLGTRVRGHQWARKTTSKTRNSLRRPGNNRDDDNFCKFCQRTNFEA